MPHSSLICLNHLHRKLPELFRRSVALEKEGLFLRNNADLANYLGISSGTVSTWLNGREDKSRERWYVSAKHLHALSELLRKLAPHIKADDAPRLWKSDSYEIFEKELWRNYRCSVLEVIQKKEPTVQIEIEKVSSLGRALVSTTDENEKDEVPTLIAGEQFFISIDTTPDRRFIIFIKATTCVQLICPTDRHGGLAKSTKERVPPAKPFKAVSEGGARQKFYVLEISEKLEMPDLGGRIRNLDHGDLLDLGAMLENDVNDDWRWGLLVVDFKDK